MTPLHGIACFYDVGFGTRAVSRKTPIYFMVLSQLEKIGLAAPYKSNAFVFPRSLKACVSFVPICYKLWIIPCLKET